MVPQPRLAWPMLILWCSGLCFFLPTMSASGFPALFVIGDSLLDAGNDVKLRNLLGFADRPPYGQDFENHRPSGRFCNGLLSSDIIASLAGLPYPPAYLVNPNDVLHGSSFASSAGGIINRTGYQVGQRLNFYQQVALFSNVRTQLITLMGVQQTSNFLAKSLVLINMGSNDYSINYFGNPLGTSPSQLKYSSEQFKDLLMSIYEQNLLELYNLGARKFGLVSLLVIGCTPFRLLLSRSVNGTCISALNDEARKFNAALLLLSQKLQKSLADAYFVYLNVYDVSADIVNDPQAYGFVSSKRSCCGSGPYGGLPCFPTSPLCANASQYVFWDFTHPSQAANEIVSQRVWAGAPPVVYPMNLKQLSQV